MGRPGAAGIYENLILACRAAGFEPVVVAEVARMLTNINLVAAGARISVVPASMREVNLQQVGYRRLWTTPGLTAPLTLGYAADDASPVCAISSRQPAGCLARRRRGATRDGASHSANR